MAGTVHRLNVRIASLLSDMDNEEIVEVLLSRKGSLLAKSFHQNQHQGQQQQQRAQTDISR